MKRWLTEGELVIKTHNNEDMVCEDTRRGASRGRFIWSWFVMPVVQSKGIHLCKRWFDKPNLDQRAAFFIHELCHEMGMFHPSFIDSASEILQLATNATDRHRVIRSPHMYQYLFLEYTGSPYTEPMI